MSKSPKKRTYTRRPDAASPGRPRLPDKDRRVRLTAMVHPDTKKKFDFLCTPSHSIGYVLDDIATVMP